MNKPWKRALSILLVIGLAVSLMGTGMVTAEESTTTTFPEYYTQYEQTPRSGVMTGTDYVELGLKMTDEEIETKIQALLNTMTGEEKSTYMGGGGTGTVYGNAGDLPGTPRLCVPEVRMHDGPSGVLSLWPTTNTPNRQMAAATWDDELIEKYGEVYGSEGKAIGENFQLGAQWHSGDWCTDTGMSIGSSVTVSMEEGKYYQVVVTGVANRTEKNLQLRLAWLTPETDASYDSATKTISGGEYDNAINLAKTSDKVVVFVTAKAGDKPSTRDADNLNISADQEQLILDVAAAAHEAGKKVIVVIYNETAITIHNWVDKVDAILMMYHPGQKGGEATAELLAGVVNPSGKLAYTMPMEGNQTLITYTEEAFNKQEQPALNSEYTVEILKGLNDGELERIFGNVNSTLQMRYSLVYNSLDEFRAALDSDKADTIVSAINSKMKSASESYYDEGILTDYRFYDSEGLEPRYDFGYGLSYTTFEYSDLSVKSAPAEGESVGYDVTFKVKNTGSVAGREVAQLYLGAASDLPEGIQSAPYQLAGYKKTAGLKPGETETVTIHVSERSLSFWNQNLENVLDKWTVAEGKRTIYVGAGDPVSGKPAPPFFTGRETGGDISAAYTNTRRKTRNF